MTSPSLIGWCSYTKASGTAAESLPSRDIVTEQAVQLNRAEDGTPVKLRLSENLSSADAATNQTIDFEVLEEVMIGDQVVIPKGSVAWGIITEAQAKRRMGRAGRLDVNIDRVRLADGEKAALRGVKDAKGGSHSGAVTAAVVGTWMSRNRGENGTAFSARPFRISA